MRAPGRVEQSLKARQAGVERWFLKQPFNHSSATVQRRSAPLNLPIVLELVLETTPLNDRNADWPKETKESKNLNF